MIPIHLWMHPHWNSLLNASPITTYQRIERPAPIYNSFIRRSFLCDFFGDDFLLAHAVSMEIHRRSGGQRVEWYYLIELLFYTSASLVPLALPISVLLSSLMTFGNLGEHNELAALKSSGVGLVRVMRPLIILMLFICGSAFLFSNYVMPVANLKGETLLRNISTKKPAEHSGRCFLWRD